MNKLKAVIDEYGRWSELSTYVERIESHIEIDFSHSLENTKALIEAIGKEICKQNGAELSDTSTINGIMKQTFKSMGFKNDAMVRQISQSLATIGQKVGDLRNEIGISSHGKTLDEIKERNSKVDIITREFLIDTVETVSVFLIRNFESQQSRTANELLEDTLKYFEAEQFNESWDDSFGDFEMGIYSYSASEILFNVDKQAYVNEYKDFIETEE